MIINQNLYRKIKKIYYEQWALISPILNVFCEGLKFPVS